MFHDGKINPFETLFKMSSVSSDQNPISKLDYNQDPLFFLNFPSPFFAEDELPLHQILSEIANQNHCAADHVDVNSIDPAKEVTKILNTKAGSKLTGKVAAEIPRKRMCKKDRHSKICTAQGVRDRRMRLPVQIARKFFDLQELLGHDRASNTIEWLLNKSEKAIKELAKDQVISSIEETKSRKDANEKSRAEKADSNKDDMPSDVQRSLFRNRKHEKIILPKRVSKPNMRESREKARARARYRTREKMLIKSIEDLSNILCRSSTNHLDLDKLGSSSGTYQDPCSRNYPNDDDFPLLEPKSFDVGIVEKLLETKTGDSSSCNAQVTDYHCSAATPFCEYPNSNLMECVGHWDLMNNYDTLLSGNHQEEVINHSSLAGICVLEILNEFEL